MTEVKRGCERHGLLDCPAGCPPAKAPPTWAEKLGRVLGAFLGAVLTFAGQTAYRLLAVLGGAVIVAYAVMWSSRLAGVDAVPYRTYLGAALVFQFVIHYAGYIIVKVVQSEGGSK